MNRRRHANAGKRHRRGAALLIVLAVLVLTVTACTILAQSAATAKLRDDLDTCSRQADAMLLAAEDPIQDWLESTSATIVLPVDADQPRAAILHDQWNIGGRTCELTITAWDQCGMVPWQLAKEASPLRLAVPANALARFDQMNTGTSDEPIGLDRLVEPSRRGAGCSPFPSAQDTPPIRFSGDEAFQETASQPPPVHPASFAAIGGLVSTHKSTAKININTAPMALVEAALRLAGRGGLDQVIAARQQGKPMLSVPTTGGLSTVSPEGLTRPTIVSASDCWSFRIDIRVDSVRRSWWAMYQFATRAHPKNLVPAERPWSCVQRLFIND